MKSGVILTEVAFCCLVFGSIVAGYSAQACPDLSWNHTFLDKAYYFLHETHTYANQFYNVCGSLGIDILVVDSLAENDFIVEALKTYEPSSESKVFLACPPSGSNGQNPPRYFFCRANGSLDSYYNETSGSRKGFWNWRDGKPDENTNGKCILLSTVDGAWSVSACGTSSSSNFVICQCRKGIQPGTLVSTKFLQKAFDDKNCLHPDLIMRVVPVHSFIECVMECQSDWKCASFNMRRGDGVTSPINCHLSLYHSSIVPGTSFIRADDCKYYEKMR